MDGDEDIYPSVDNNKGFKARGLPNIQASKANRPLQPTQSLKIRQQQKIAYL